MSDLIKRLRSQTVVDATPLEVDDLTDEAADALEAANARIAELEAHVELLRQELKNIANADTIAWDDPTEFEAWAKSRARHALEKTK